MRRPWVVYWIVHGLAVLGADLPAQPSVASIVEFLATCQAPDGGFGGGPYQLPHLATTYAGAWAPSFGAEFWRVWNWTSPQATLSIFGS